MKCLVLVPEVFEDERGFFMEIYREDGLHFQWEPPMGKLMRVTLGTAFLVAVDIRKGSPTLGQWYGDIVSAKNKKQIWAPAGFARGFCVLSDFAEIQYKCTGIYNKSRESGILWNDPEIGIESPVKNPINSRKKMNMLKRFQIG